MKRSYVLAVVLTLSALGQAAWAKQVKFVGAHPINSKAGGFCYIEVPHVHVYAPSPRAEVAYRMHDGAYFFVGDPVPHGYDGPRHAYNGHHPVSADVLIGETEIDGDETEYCYLQGPHYHYFSPPPGPDFEVRGGVTYYVGHFPEVYVKAKPRYVRVNAYYDDYDYVRPVVLVAPPPAAVYGVVGLEVVAPVADVHVHGHGPPVHGDVHAGVGVHAGVEVNLPMPVVEVQVPGVVVEEHHHHIHSKHKHKRKHWRGKGHWK